jgi:hypothetical protein
VPTELPQLLDLGAPRLLGYTPESSIAEKFQAMVALDIANTRIKDFYDVWSLSRVREFDGRVLAAAIFATFERRATPLPEGTPLALSDVFSADPAKQRLWQAFLRKGRLDAGGKGLPAVVDEIRVFLLPPVVALKACREFRGVWRDGGWWEAG